MSNAEAADALAAAASDAIAAATVAAAAADAIHGRRCML